MFEISFDAYKPPYEALPLGHQGEKEARCLVWDLTDYIDEFGDGNVQVKVTQPESGEIYLATNVTKVGSRAIWTLTNVDTAKAGEGRCELYYEDTAGNVLAKSHVMKFWILPTQGEAGDTPSPYEELLEQVSQLVNDAETAAGNAETSAEAAAASATQSAQAAATAVAEEVAVLQAELDQAISGATEDSEVINARVTSDGTTYSTLKQRLDAENTELKNEIDWFTIVDGAVNIIITEEAV